MAWQCIQVGSESGIEVARQLFREYAADIGVDLSFQGFEEEWRGLPGDYAPPRGRLLLAQCDGEVGGCVALRPLEERGVGEVKRLYVRPAHRRAGLGRRLVACLLQEARAAGYERLRLDTLASMTPANRLYQSLGFKPIAAYRFNPHPDAVYMEWTLPVSGPNRIDSST